MLALAVAIAGYGLSFVWRGLDAFGDNLLISFNQRPWAIWLHFTFGPVALVAGALNFRHSIRRARPALHRRLGETYVFSALATGLVGGYLAIYAYGGVPNRFGFGGLALATLVTTVTAYRFAVARDLKSHRRWMIRSYAMILAAVTLRIELPLLANYFQSFDAGYRIVAWSCWVPNLLVAEIFVRRTKHPA